LFRNGFLALTCLRFLPELEAKRYEGKIKEGNILISVLPDTSAEISRAKDIFTKAGAEDICTTGGDFNTKGA
jgi:hypothetical protein